MAPERRFRQCEVIGRRRKAGNATRVVQEMLTWVHASEDGAAVLTPDYVDAPDLVPRPMKPTSTSTPCGLTPSSSLMSGIASEAPCFGKTWKRISGRLRAQSGHRCGS